MNKPFYWKARKGWYIKVDRKNVKLDAKTKEQAYAVWRKGLERGSRLAADQSTLGDVLELYVTAMQGKVNMGQLAESTLTRRLDYLGSAVAHSVSRVPIAVLRPFHALEWLDTEPGWNATTRHHAAAALKAAMSWAKSVGRIDTNPLESLKVEKGEARDFLISPELYATFINHLLGQDKINARSFARVLMALRHSGCRPSEIANVRVEHINVSSDGMTWILPYHKNRRKKKAPRVVYCSPCLRTITLAAKGDRTSGPLFLANYGEAFAYSRMRVRFERMRKRLGIADECVLYSFRHTSITNMMVAGEGVATVAELHGTSIQMIQNHYGHLSQHAKFLHDAVTRAAASPYLPLGQEADSTLRRAS